MLRFAPLYGFYCHPTCCTFLSDKLEFYSLGLVGVENFIKILVGSVLSTFSFSSVFMPVQVDDVTKTEYEDVWEWEVQNDNKPIWTRNPKEVEKEQYDSFYKQTFSEFLEPLAHSHFSVEGTIEFSSILFVPGMAPFEQVSTVERVGVWPLHNSRLLLRSLKGG